MPDLQIDQLSLHIENAVGHEHRIQPIAARAAALFAEQLHARWANGGQVPASGSIENVSAPAVSLNLGSMSNEQAAYEIASAWLAALALKLQP
jgi:hypothetical protein